MTIGIILAIWAAITFVSICVYLSTLSDEDGYVYFSSINKAVIAGCIFWFFPLLIYLFVATIELYFWAYDTLCLAYYKHRTKR